MSFAGSVQAMITSLKNNARPKRRASELLKENERISTGRKNKLRFKSIPENELSELKLKIRNDLKRESRHKSIIVLLILIPIVFWATFYFIQFWKNIEETSRKEAIKREIILHQINEEKDAEFMRLLNDGYKWLNKEKYGGAKLQIGRALEIKPEDRRAKIAYTTAFVYDCIKNNEECEKAEQMLLLLEKKYPLEKSILELGEYFTNSKK